MAVYKIDDARQALINYLTIAATNQHSAADVRNIAGALETVEAIQVARMALDT